jgi:hypothetical protein
MVSATVCIPKANQLQQRIVLQATAEEQPCTTCKLASLSFLRILDQSQQ